MNQFIHEDFLLRTETARRLFHEQARDLPIIDYHCHLDPADLAEDRWFENIAQAWLVNDPYKHRAMRIAGVPEHFISGKAGDREKFDRWAATVPQTLGNPLLHWSALELKRYFGIAELLSENTGAHIWETCNAQLRSPEYSARQLVSRAKVECVCTSDRLLDDLKGHAILARSDFSTKVLPSLRADELLAVELPGYTKWVRQLAEATGTAIKSYDSFQQAVIQRLDCFQHHGCRLSDQGLNDFAYATVADDEAAGLFQQRLFGAPMNREDIMRLRSGILRFLGLEYGRRNWGMQMHIGAHRQTSTRLRNLAGPFGGYAALDNGCDIPSLCAFLDDLEKQSLLPRTVLYPLNPADNAAFAVLTGSYAEDSVRGKIQFGPAWWYNDHALGIRNQLETLASYGLLSTFIGMTTDSRSVLSMVRHEYFRRILCGFFGDQVEAGAFPSDEQFLGEQIRAIACDNARCWLFPKTKDTL